jgi:hypothetical protein
MARISRAWSCRASRTTSPSGNRREPVFFGAQDYQLYRRLIATAARRDGAEICAYCLMLNHVHLIVALAARAGLAVHLEITLAAEAWLGQFGDQA